MGFRNGFLITLKLTTKIIEMKINTMAEMMANGETPEILFWVGCAGSFDQRAQKITKAFATILTKVGVKFAILGKEEACTGDPARRAGNEFLFQMMAYQNIQVLNGYGIKKIVTTCPHCFNTLKNEYPQLGGVYQVQHHTEYIEELLAIGKLKLEASSNLNGKRITFHDPCYLGRANEVYEAPRNLLKAIGVELVEMKRNRRTGLCCGAGGGQMFKEPEKGDKDINVLRTEDAIETQPEIIATGCPYCNTMMTDGVKAKEKEDSIKVFDVAELIANSQNL